jgi:dTDP-4-amino-4,6-dideoxygalactose transaminase
MATTRTKLSDLAINGGPKAVTEEIPYVGFGVHELGEEEKRYVNDVLNRKAVFRWQDAKNSYVMRFEEGFAKKTGAKHALAVSSGTAALVTGLTALGIGPGDEVIVPAYTYIASASAVILVGAVPVIAEIDDTLTLDPKDFERNITPYTKAVMPVHMRGIPCDMDKIMRIAKKHKIAVIEDASQCDGGTYKGKRIGTIGHVGCFSLQASKTITSGEGGVVVTNDDHLYARAAIAHDSGIAFWRKLSEELTKKVTLQAFAGQGYRMNELAGAVAFAQLHKLDKIVAVCRQRKKELLRDIAGAPGLKPMRVPDPDGECAYSANFLFDSAEEAQRFAQALSAEGVRVHTIHNEGFPDRHIYKYWDYVLNKVPISEGRDPWRDPRYKGNVVYSADMCPQTMSVLTRTVAVPLNQRMTSKHSRLIAKAIKKVAQGLYG